MSKSTKMIAALGIVAGLGVTALPLSGAVSADSNSGQSPQSATAPVTLDVLAGVAIATSGATVTNPTAGGATATVTDNTSGTAVSAQVTAGGVPVRSANATKVVASSSNAFKVTVTAGNLTSTTATGSDAIAWSGTAVAQNQATSNYNIYYGTDPASGVTLLDATNASVPTQNADATGTSIATGAAGGTATVYTVYDFVAKSTQDVAADYTGTVTYTNSITS